MAEISNYGTLYYGSRKLTIGGVIYIADNCNVSRPTVEVGSKTEIGEPGAFALVHDTITGSAQCQIPTSGNKPQLGATFTTTFDSSLGAETFVITGVTSNEDQASPKKENITYRSTAIFS